MTQDRPILVTGGAGFIGSNFVLDWLAHEGAPVVNIDLLTYAGNQANLAAVANDARYTFVQADVADLDAMEHVLRQYAPAAIVHFAAETHVDRSVLGPLVFVRSNVDGTAALLEASRGYHQRLAPAERDAFRFLHVSTDEVYGTLAPEEPAFTETTPFSPNSPYAASKAASDLLARAWHHTYGLPVLITNCSNNYGPFQFPEKLIPLVITQALAGKELPIYGDGQQVRDWLYVGDHTAAIRRVLQRGTPGETYNIGGNCQETNLDVVRAICRLLDELAPALEGQTYEQQIRFVTDRPAHDRRYAVDTTKIARELQWAPAHSFAAGLRSTVQWYLDHPAWVDAVRTGAYRDWMAQNYGPRASQAEPANPRDVTAVEAGR